MGWGVIDGIGGMVTAVGQQAVNYFGSRINNEFAREQSDYDRQQNYRYATAAAVDQDIRTRQLYKDLYSPKAQLEMLREAGLSPSIYFGEGAAGLQGQTAATNAGTAGPQSQVFGISPIDIADIKLKEAQTEKLQEETKTEAGTNERGRAEIDNIMTHTDNVKLKNAWQGFNNKIEEISSQIAESTKGDVIDIKHQELLKFEAETEKLVNEARSAKIQGDIDETTFNDVVEYQRERVRNLTADTLLKGTEKRLAEHKIKLTDKQIEKLVNDMSIDWANYFVEKYNSETKRMEYTLKDKEFKQHMREWATANGIPDENNSFTDILFSWMSENFSIKSLTHLLFTLR